MNPIFEWRAIVTLDLRTIRFVKPPEDVAGVENQYTIDIFMALGENSYERTFYLFKITEENAYSAYRELVEAWKEYHEQKS